MEKHEKKCTFLWIREYGGEHRERCARLSFDFCEVSKKYISNIGGSIEQGHCIGTLSGQSDHLRPIVMNFSSYMM